jgi:adenylate cyclase
MINAALNRDFLHEPSRAANLAVIFAAGLVAWLISALLDRPVLKLILLMLAVLGYYALAQTLLNTTGFYLILLSPVLALTGSGVVWLVWERVIDRLEKQKLRRTLDRYVSKDVVKELVDNPASFLNTLGRRAKADHGALLLTCAASRRSPSR